MEVVLKKMGNSTALVMPPPVLKDLGMRVGQHLTLNTTESGQIVLTRKKKFVLADMIAKCDLEAPPPADLAILDTVAPVGQEIL